MPLLPRNVIHHGAGEDHRPSWQGRRSFFDGDSPAFSRGARVDNLLSTDLSSECGVPEGHDPFLCPQYGAEELQKYLDIPSTSGIFKLQSLKRNCWS